MSECRARFDAVREVFEVQEGQPTKNYITMIVEVIDGVLYPLRYDTEEGKGNLLGIILPDPKYKAKFGHSFRVPTRPGVSDKKLKGDKVTVEIRVAKSV